MAKKKHLDDFDDFSGFDDFNFDDLGFDSEPVKDDRNPVTKIAGSFAKGMKDKAHNRDFQKQILKKALPKDYESGFDAFDEVSSFFRTFTDDVKRELKPGLREIRDASRKMFPGKAAFVPESLRNKLNEYLDEDQGIVTSQSQEKEDSAKVGMMLGEIFAEQAKYDESKTRDQLVRDEIKNVTERKRFEASYKEGVRTNSLLTSMVNYQDKVTTAYRKRMLELQYKSYITQARTLETLKITNEKTNAFLEAIAKNTALPDFAKLHNKEAVKELLRRRMINMVVNGASSKVDGLFGQVLGAAGKGALNLAKSFSEAAASVSGILDMNDDPFDDTPKSAKDTVVKGAQFGAEMGGGAIMEHYAEKFVGPIRDWIMAGGDGSIRKKIVNAGKHVNYYAGNRDQLMQNALRNAERGEGGIFGDLLTLMGLTDLAYKNDSSLTKKLSGIDALGGPGGSERQRLTIEEVIPGWLNKIWGELRMTRTGESSYESESFDFKHRKFVKSSKSTELVANALFTEGKADFLNNRSEKLAKEMLGGASVSQEALQALTRKIKMDALEGISPQPEKYRFSLGMPISEKAQDEIRTAIEKHYGYDFENDKFSSKTEFIERRNKLQVGYKTVESNISRARNDALKFMDEGHIEGLRQLGLVKETDTGLDFDYNRYFELAEQGVDLSSLNIPPPPEGTRKSKRKSFRRGSDKRAYYGEPSRPAPNASFSQAEDAAKTPSKMLEETMTIRAQGQMQLEILKEILQKLYTGIPSSGTIPSDDEDGGKGSKPFILDFNNMARRIGEAGKSLGGLAGSIFWGPTSLTRFVWGKRKSVRSAIGEAAGLVNKNVLTPMREKLNQLTDVYFGDEGLPRLTFKGFMSKEYRDKTTGEIIKRIEDLKNVKEAVVDSSGKVLLTAEEIAKGLKDRHGKKLSAIRDGIVQKAKEGIASGLSAAGGLLRGIGNGFRSEGFQEFQSSVFRAGARGIGGATELLSKLTGGLPDMVGGAVNKVKDFAKGGLGLMGFGSAGVLERIYRLLDYRMPGAPGSHLNDEGDIDNDGVRDNSWQDRKKKREDAEAADEAADAANEKDLLKKGGFLSGLMGMLGAGRNKGGEEEEGEGGGIMDSIGGFFGLGGGKDKGTPRPRGSWWKDFKKKPIRTVGGSLLRGGGTLLKSAFSLAPALAVGKAGLGLAAGIGKLGLALAFSPIGLALIAGGTAAYFGYKWFKKRQNFKKNYMLQLRAMHYGFDHENEEHINRMIEMEKLWAPLYKNPGSYKDAFSEPTDPEFIPRFMAILGCNYNDQYQAALAALWWEKRGGPIMTMWFNKVFEHTQETNLDKLSGDNGVSPDVNVNILKDLSIPIDNPDSPINFPVHPIGGEENEAPVGEDVVEFYEEVVERAKEHSEEHKEEIKEKAEDEARKKKNEERKAARLKELENLSGKDKKETKTDPFMGVLKANRDAAAQKNKDLTKELGGILTGALNADYSKKWVWPVKDGQITSKFGPRLHPVYGDVKPHKGVDIAAPEGTPVMAAQAGVIRVMDYLKGYGNSVYIEHDNGTHTRYAHLAAFADELAVGSRVYAGQVIGYVGNTGVGTGPHLHFEVRNGTDLGNTVAAVDPIQYINDSNLAYQQKKMQQQEAALAAGGEELLDPITASLEGANTVGVKRKTDILPKDEPLMLANAGAGQAAASNQVNNQKTTSSAAISEAKSTLDTEDLVNVGYEQVKGIGDVSAGVGNMTEEQRRANAQLEQINKNLSANNSGPVFNTPSSVDPKRTAGKNNQTPETITVVVEMADGGKPRVSQSNGSSTRVNVAQTTRTSASDRSM